MNKTLKISLIVTAITLASSPVTAGFFGFESDAEEKVRIEQGVQRYLDHRDAQNTKLENQVNHQIVLAQTEERRSEIEAQIQRNALKADIRIELELALIEAKHQEAQEARNAEIDILLKEARDAREKAKMAAWISKYQPLMAKNAEIKDN